MTNQHTFTIKWKSPSSGQIEEGMFTTKKLSIAEIARVGVRTAQLSGGMHCVRDDDGRPTGQGIDDNTEWVNHMLAHLEFSLVQKPVWFNVNDLWDMGLVREVYQEVSKFETSFKSTGIGGNSGSGGLGQAGGSGERPQAAAGNVPTPVVGSQVSASLDA